MLRSILLSLAFLVATPAFAQNAGPNPCANLAEATKGLSSEKTATLLESCRTSSAVPATIEKMADPDTANKWSQAAKGFAEALGIAAKELGIAANDFLDSPAGYLLAAILLFNYAGGAIVGFPFTIFTLIFWWYVNRRVLIESVEHERVPVMWGAFSIRRVKNVVYEKSEYTAIFHLLSALALVVLNLVVWLNVT
ncbi:hypothetical protein AAY80_134 [Stenotrophomonas phage vB_SmaS-DLP_6]|nr:hypothetical protein AAY80_134 [Stenotrophomonas phage vB_SmaS-DLP_6]